MRTSSNGLKLIEEFEGCILQAYDDYNDKVVSPGQSCRGTLTIGFGHTSAAGSPSVYIGQTISRQQADDILASDLYKVEQQVTNLVKVPLDQNQFDALVSFEFNTGALSRSTALRLLNAGDYKGAADALLMYNKASGRVLPGLIRRRQAERNLFLLTTLTIPTKEITHDPDTSSGSSLVAVLWRNILRWFSLWQSSRSNNH